MFGFGSFSNEETEKIAFKTVKEAVSSGTIVLTAINVGAPTDGSTVTISDTLPAQLGAGEAKGWERYGPHEGLGIGNELLCSRASRTITCTYTGVMETGDALKVRIPVAVLSDSPSILNNGFVTGGGAEMGGSVSSPLTASDEPAGFGVAPGSVVMATSSRQAGSHPDITTNFAISTIGEEQTAGNLKDVRVDLPPGLVGNTVGMPRCSTARALARECPRDTIVGVASIEIRSTFQEGFKAPILIVEPVFNVEPSPGEPAAFVFTGVAFPVRLDTSVLSDGNYAVRVTASDITEADVVLSSTVTIWGVPADHEGFGPIELQSNNRGELAGGLGGPAANVTRVPLLTNPTQCSDSVVRSRGSRRMGQSGSVHGRIELAWAP